MAHLGERLGWREGVDALGGGGDGAEDGPRSAQQVQFTEALVAEVAALLDALGLSSRVPVILCGDWNSKPGKPAHTAARTLIL